MTPASLLLRLLLAVLALAVTFPIPTILFEWLGRPSWVAAWFAPLTAAGLAVAAAVLLVTRRIRRVRHAWGAPLLLLLSVLTPLVVLEWGCRLVSSPTWSEASHWRWYALEVKRNEAGLRGPSIGWLADDRIRPIVVLGDSFAFGYKVPQDQILPHRLEEKLRPDFPVRVINAANPNWSIAEQKKFYHENAPLLGPALVVVCHVMNDIPVRIEFTPGSRALVWFYYNAYASRLVRPAIDAVVHRSFVADTLAAYRPENPAWTSYFQALRDLDQRVTARGGRLSVVLFPWFVDFNAYPFADVHQRMEAQMKKLSIPYLDLLPAYRDFPAEELIVSRTDFHPNARAHEIAAEALAAFLKDRFLKS